MDRDKVLDLLEAADWKDIILRLTHYAYWKSSKYTWRSGDPDRLPGGKTPEDIALGAVQKVWTGERDWDPDKYPDLLKHIMRIIDSDLNHLINSAEYKKSVRMPERIDEMGTGGAHDEALDDTSSPIQKANQIRSPEEQLIAREQREFEEKVKNEFYDTVKGDEDLEMLWLCFDEGIDKPEKIATQTGWDIQKVNNVKRKLFRKAGKFKKIIEQIK